MQGKEERAWAVSREDKTLAVTQLLTWALLKTQCPWECNTDPEQEVPGMCFFFLGDFGLEFIHVMSLRNRGLLGAAAHSWKSRPPQEVQVQGYLSWHTNELRDQPR